MQSKDRLRKKYYNIRKKNYFDVESNFFNPLFKLIKKKYNKKNINLSIYYPASFEVNVLKLFKKKITKNINFLLPVIKEKNIMDFYEWNNHRILKINKFGMLEPFVRSNHTTPNIMLVPLLAYDNEKNRLGFGKGFYDRYLKKYLKKYNNILTIGIAFSFQKHHKLPVSNNDIKLNHIITEKGIF
jgi:5-formyltetrahydrofolate cyclo-ligase